MPTIPTDGRMTSFTAVPSALSGDELFWIVQPGNAASGVLYNVTATVLAAYFASNPSLATTIVTSGAELGDPYDVLTNQARVLFNKTVGSASYVLFPLVSVMLYAQPVLIKDIKGDADTNPITIEFTGGQLVDGLSTYTISNPYGWVWINPVPGGTSWYTT